MPTHTYATTDALISAVAQLPEGSEELMQVTQGAGSTWTLTYPDSLTSAVQAANPALPVPVIEAESVSLRASFSMTCPKRVWREVFALTPISNAAGDAVTIVGGCLRIERPGLYHVSAYATQDPVDDTAIAILVNEEIVQMATAPQWTSFKSAASCATVLALVAGDQLTFDVAVDNSNRTATGQIAIARVGD